MSRARLTVRGQTLGVEERWTFDVGPPWVRRWFRWRSGERVIDQLEAGQLPPGPWRVTADAAAVAPPIADPTRVYAVPSQPIAAARRQRRLWVTTSLPVPNFDGLQSRDAGGVVALTAPLPDELPAATRARIEAVIQDVRSRLPGGDCQALSRATAAQLDGEVVAGLAYLDEDRPPGFYPHAWVLVRHRGAWIPVDPTLSLPVADAARLILGPDDPDGAREFLTALAAEVTLTVTARPPADNRSP